MSPARIMAAPGTSAPVGLAPVADILGDNIRQLRMRKDWRQVDLIHELGELGVTWSKQTMSTIESGQRQITVTELVCVALALGVSVPQLLDPRPDVTMTLRRTWEWLPLRADELRSVLGTPDDRDGEE